MVSGTFVTALWPCGWDTRRPAPQARSLLSGKGTLGREAAPAAPAALGQASAGPGALQPAVVTTAAGRASLCAVGAGI